MTTPATVAASQPKCERCGGSGLVAVVVPGDPFADGPCPVCQPAASSAVAPALASGGAGVRCVTCRDAGEIESAPYADGRTDQLPCPDCQDVEFSTVEMIAWLKHWGQRTQSWRNGKLITDAIADELRSLARLTREAADRDAAFAAMAAENAALKADLDNLTRGSWSRVTINALRADNEALHMANDGLRAEIERKTEALEACAESLALARDRLGMCGEGDGKDRKADAPDDIGSLHALTMARAALTAPRDTKRDERGGV